MITESLRDVLRAYGTRIILWGEIHARKLAPPGGMDETLILYVSSHPGYFFEATTAKPFRHFLHPWDAGLRLKRSAQNVLRGDPATSVLDVNGTWEFLNHDKAFDLLFGAQGYETTGEVVETGYTAVPPAYSGRALGPQTGVLVEGIAGPRRLTDETLQIAIGNGLSKLQQKVATEKITAIAYPFAADAVIGVSKPLLLGTCLGVELLLVDPTVGGGKYLVAGHGCASGTFYRNGLVMTGGEYTPELTADDGSAYITLAFGLQGARITGDIAGITPSHLAAFSDKLTEINIHLLLSVGIPLVAIDTSGLALARTTYNYSVGLPIFIETSVQDVWDQLNAGIPILRDQWRDGTYQIAPWTEPSGTAELTINDNFILAHEVQEAPRVRGTTLRYAQQATVLSPSEIAGILFEDNPSRAATIQKDAQEHTELIAGASADLDLPTYDTRLLSLADVKKLAQIRNALYGTPHLHHRIDVGAIGAGIAGLGSVIALDRNRLGLDVTPNLVRIADIEETWDSSGVQISLIAVEERR